MDQMKADIIAVGSELLTPDRMDTNSLFLTDAGQAFAGLAHQRHRISPGQCRALPRRKLRRLAPDHHEVEFIDGNAETLAQQNMMLHAEGAAIDLRRAQLDQFEQLLVDAGLCGGLA